MNKSWLVSLIILSVITLLSGCIPAASVPDAIAPELTLIAPVDTPTNSTTPSFSFSSSEMGTITYGGACKSSKTAAYGGLNTVFLSALAQGTYNNCTVKVTDAAGNASNTLTLPAFQIVLKPRPINDTGMTYCGDYATSTASMINTLSALTTSPAQSGTAGTTANTFTNVPLTTVSGSGSGAQATIVTASTATAIGTLGTLTGGSGYLPASGTATYTDVALTNSVGSGSGARANITVTNGAVTAVVLNTNSSGSGYATSNTLTAALSTIGGGTTGSGFAIGVSAVATVIRVTSVTLTAYGNGYAVNDKLSAASGNIGGVTGFQAVVASIGRFNDAVVCSTAGATKTVAGADSDGDAVPAGQDAVYGRDADPALNDNSNGQAAFSYTKLDSSGNITSGTPACVKDNVTGLIWEVKTDSSDLRDKDWTYTWYTSGTYNGGAAGTADTGVGVGSDNCSNTSRCDTEKFVADVNAATLCGASDWRLPTAAELATMRTLNRTSPAIDTNFFPNTLTTGNYWSASPDSSSTANAWTFTLSTGAFAQTAKSTAGLVRLVRGGQ